MTHLSFEVEFVGGYDDGMKMTLAYLYPEYRLPVIEPIDFIIPPSTFPDQPIQTRVKVYRRLADTLNYIYIKTE